MTIRASEMSHRGPGPTADVFDWDEARDPTRAPTAAPQKPKPKIGRFERGLLEALSDGEWVSEKVLRKALGWGRMRFFLTTMLSILTGRVEARPENSFFTSKYRLSPKEWA